MLEAGGDARCLLQQPLPGAQLMAGLQPEPRPPALLHGARALPAHLAALLPRRQVQQGLARLQAALLLAAGAPAPAAALHLCREALAAPSGPALQLCREALAAPPGPPPAALAETVVAAPRLRRAAAAPRQPAGPAAAWPGGWRWGWGAEALQSPASGSPGRARLPGPLPPPRQPPRPLPAAPLRRLAVMQQPPPQALAWMRLAPTGGEALPASVPPRPGLQLARQPAAGPKHLLLARQLAPRLGPTARAARTSHGLPGLLLRALPAPAMLARWRSRQLGRGQACAQPRQAPSPQPATGWALRLGLPAGRR